MEKYYSFFGKAILTEEALDKAGRKNKNSTRLENEELCKRLSLDKLDEDFIAKSEKMSYVYTTICAFENTLRNFIFKKLSEKFGEEWWEKGISEKIRTKAESLKKEEERNRWHSMRETENLLSYTEFGHLIDIMGRNWELFEPHINSIEWARNIIKTLERSRNVIMHSGELSIGDIERIGIHVRDWIRQVGA